MMIKKSDLIDKTLTYEAMYGGIILGCDRQGNLYKKVVLNDITCGGAVVFEGVEFTYGSGFRALGEIKENSIVQFDAVLKRSSCGRDEFGNQISDKNSGYFLSEIKNIQVVGIVPRLF